MGQLSRPLSFDFWQADRHIRWYGSLYEESALINKLCACHSFNSSSQSDLKSGMKGFSVSGCVSKSYGDRKVIMEFRKLISYSCNTLRKVTTPTDSRFFWIERQHIRNNVFCASLTIICNIRSGIRWTMDASPSSKVFFWCDENMKSSTHLKN